LALNQARVTAFQVLPHHIHAAHLGFHPALSLKIEHLILKQTLSQLDNLDIGMLEPPDLAFGQSRYWCLALYFAYHVY
jgi:hypothetical protein